MVHTDAPLPWPASPPGVFKVACVARLSARDKGQDVLLSVLSRPIWRERPLEVNFFGMGETARGFQELAGQLGLARVRFCGHAEDVLQVWREHHALILTSRHEGLPLALVGAMRCGRFGIVTPAGGMAEVVRDEETGFVAKHSGEEALHEVMERAWKRRAEWEQIGLAASCEIRRRVPEDPCEVFAEKLAALHAEAASAPAAEPCSIGGLVSAGP